MKELCLKVNKNEKWACERVGKKSGMSCLLSTRTKKKYALFMGISVALIKNMSKNVTKLLMHCCWFVFVFCTNLWDQIIIIIITTLIRKCPWCNGYRRRKWTRRHEFKSWTRLIAFHIALIPLGKGMNPIIIPPAMGK